MTEKLAYVHVASMCGVVTTHTALVLAVMGVPSGPKLVPVSSTTEPPASARAAAPEMDVLVDTS